MAQSVSDCFVFALGPRFRGDDGVVPSPLCAHAIHVSTKVSKGRGTLQTYVILSLSKDLGCGGPKPTRKCTPSQFNIGFVECPPLLNPLPRRGEGTCSADMLRFLPRLSLLERLRAVVAKGINILLT